jgi:hypothetical protein
MLTLSGAEPKLREPAQLQSELLLQYTTLVRYCGIKVILVVSRKGRKNRPFTHQIRHGYPRDGSEQSLCGGVVRSNGRLYLGIVRRRERNIAKWLLSYSGILNTSGAVVPEIRASCGYSILHAKFNCHTGSTDANSSEREGSAKLTI